MNILLIFPGLIIAFIIVQYYECKIRNLSKNHNNVHFYVARDKNTILYLYLGKPKRSYYSFTPCKKGYCFMSDFQKFGLNPDDFNNLKWEDEPVELKGE